MNAFWPATAEDKMFDDDDEYIWWRWKIIQLNKDIIPTVSDEIKFELNKHRNKIRWFIDENPNLQNIPGVFPPDWWSETQLTPVSHEVANSDKPLNILELGTWSGFNLLYLIINFFEKRKLWKLIWSDIVKEAVDTTRSNIESLNMEWLTYELFTSDWFNNISPEALEWLDIMFACLPQVYLPWYKGWPIDLSNYYIKENYKDSKYNEIWFWLIEKIIKQAIDKISNTKLLMNVSWRINQKVIKSLFEEIWYNIKIAYEQIIPHHKGTKLWMYEDIELVYGEDYVWEFYEDPEWKKQISVKEAEYLRKNYDKYGKEIYHPLYVIGWTPNNNDNVIPLHNI